MCYIVLSYCNGGYMAIWKAIPGYEGYYEASDDGHVRVLRQLHAKGMRHKSYPYVLANLPYRKGYKKMQFGVCHGTRPRKRLFVHRVVYATFKGPIPPGLTINHIDGNTSNNHIDNLELATHQEQAIHARSLGGCKGTRKTPSPLTDEIVLEIRRILAETPPPTNRVRDELAAKYGVSNSCIRFIEIRRTWRYLP